MYKVYDKDGNKVGEAKTYAAAYAIAKEKGKGKIDIRWEDNGHHFTRI